MVTSLVFFIPISAWFLIEYLPTMSAFDIFIGFIIGLVLNVGGVIGLIRVMEDPNAPAFEPRQVQPALRYARS
jgi:hypothetical protein